MLVPKARTVVALEPLCPAFCAAFEAAHGSPPEPGDVAMVYGKLCNECGHPGPGQSCWCNNVGNIRGRSPAGLYCLLAGAHEYAPAGRVPKGWHQIPNPPGHAVPPGMVACLPDDSSRQEFRAYLSLREACDDYVSVLGARFPRAWRELAREGSSPDAFVDALKADRYFTGDPANYRRNVAAVARSVLPRVEALMAAQAAPATREAIAFLESMPLIRAGEGQHDPGLMPDPDFSDARPWWKRLLGVG